MSNPIATARAQGKFKSNDDLAKRLIAQYDTLKWPTPRSVSVKIGEIDRGDTVWWRKRPDHANALSEILGLPTMDLGLHDTHAERPFEFITFPELPPLDLKKEAPCDIATPVGATESMKLDLSFWLDAVPWRITRYVAGISWLHFPRGTGLSLFWERITATSRHDHIRVGKLSEAKDRMKHPAPIIIRLENEIRLDTNEGRSDLLTLASRHQDAPVLIAAPFAAPRDEDSSDRDPFFSWEYISKSREELEMMNLTNSQEMLRGIDYYEWKLLPDWQDRLLNWVEKRIRSTTEDTLFSASGVRRWLANFLPWETFKPLPADLLAICRICHSEPETRLPQTSDIDAGKKLLKSILSIKPSIARFFIHLIEARLFNSSIPWQGALPLRAWSSLSTELIEVPDEGAFLAIADAPNKDSRRRKATDLYDHFLATTPMALVPHGLLVEDSNGDFELEPRLLVNLLARDIIIQRIVNDTSVSWASHYFDAERRPLIDAALEAISIDDLIPVAARIYDLPLNSPLAIAASDALFWSVGKRIPALSIIPAPLHHLAHMVISRFTPGDAGPTLWSRDILTEDKTLAWAGICWAWSLTPIENLPTIHETWPEYFPGWAPEIAEFYCWPLVGDTFPEDKEPLSREWLRMLEIAAALLAKISSPIMMPPNCLKPLLIAEGLKGRWPVNPKWLVGVVANHHAEAALQKELKTIGPSAAKTLLPLLVDLSVRMAKENPKLGYWMFLRSSIRTWVLEQISAEDMFSCLSESQFKTLLATPEALPQHLQSAILERCATNDPVFIEAAIEIIPACNADLSPILEKCLNSDLICTAAALRLWQVAPHEAMHLMQRKELDRQSVRALIFTAPNAAMVQTAEIISKYPDILSKSDKIEWIKSKLPYAQTSAEIILSILETNHEA